jgi:hypothetical protein
MLLGLAFLQRKFACAWNDQMRFASSILRLNNYVLIYSLDYFLFTTIVTLESISKLRVIRQTANARQRKMLWYQAIKSKWNCCFKTEIRNYSFDARKKIWNENVRRQFCEEGSNLSFAVPGNVKLKLPITFLTVFILTHPVNVPCDSFHAHESVARIEPTNSAELIIAFGLRCRNSQSKCLSRWDRGL